MAARDLLDRETNLSPHSRHLPHDLLATLLAAIGDIIDFATRQQGAHLHRALAAGALRGVDEQAVGRRGGRTHDD